MCTAYRYDLLDGKKVEGLCLCDCHKTGARGIHGVSHAMNMADDPERFEQARLISWELTKTDGIGSDNR
jgi:hypothetical protein